MVKKKLIIEKSLELFAKQGFKATSVQQITDLCGISKGAFYLSFESKDQLIIEIIDHCMMNVISDIDYAVKSCRNQDNLLYEFYFTALRSFSQHLGFVSLFVMEQSLPPNNELFSRLAYYEKRMNQIILFTLHEQYRGQLDELMIYDLLICVNGFIRNYAELVFHNKLDVDLNTFVRSVVEKTNILAEHSTLPSLSAELFKQKISSPGFGSDQARTNIRKNERDQIITLIEQEIHEIDDPVELESLEILIELLLTTQPRLAIIKGLLENIKGNPHCKWIAYLVREYYHL